MQGKPNPFDLITDPFGLISNNPSGLITKQREFHGRIADGLHDIEKEALKRLAVRKLPRLIKIAIGSGK